MSAKKNVNISNIVYLITFQLSQDVWPIFVIERIIEEENVISPRDIANPSTTTTNPIPTAIVSTNNLNCRGSTEKNIRVTDMLNFKDISVVHEGVNYMLYVSDFVFVTFPIYVGVCDQQNECTAKNFVDIFSNVYELGKNKYFEHMYNKKDNVIF
jgi:hypothetical protein